MRYIKVAQEAGSPAAEVLWHLQVGGHDSRIWFWNAWLLQHIWTWQFSAGPWLGLHSSWDSSLLFPYLSQPLWAFYASPSSLSLSSLVITGPDLVRGISHLCHTVTEDTGEPWGSWLS